ncbi:MAG: hypothetical protein ACK5KO_10405, partial [Arachnia sp.]
MRRDRMAGLVHAPARPQPGGLPVRFLRRHRGMLLVALVAAGGGALAALGARHTAVTVGVGFNAWDVVLSATQDPYLQTYFLWPLMTLSVGYDISRRGRAEVLVRYGSRSAFVLSQALRAGGIGVGLALAVLLGCLPVAADLDWVMAWSPFGAAVEILNPLLYALAEAHLAMVPVVLTQVAYAALSSAALGALLAAANLALSHRFRALLIAIALAMPIAFKAWPFPAQLNPFNAVVMSHGLAAGLPLWAPPLGCLAVILMAGAVTLAVDWRIDPAFLARLYQPRWAWYAGVVGLGIGLMTLRLVPDISLTYQLFYGADRDGVSILNWSFGVIVWVGLAFVLMLGWSHTLTARLPYLLVRYGRGESLVVRLMGRALWSSLAWTVGLLLVTSALDLATGRPTLDLASAAQLCVAGPLT